MAIEYTGETIDITPTDEGYKNITRMFAENILGDVKIARRAASRDLMVSVIELAGYLGQHNPALLIALKNEVKGRAEPE
jgi:hypothetical protein